MSDSHTHIDIYCERMDPSFWAEPINAWTNAAFILSSILLFFLVRLSGHGDWRAYSLVFLVFMIGTGSFLFHTFATPWAAAMDVIPILLYQVLFIFFYCRDVMLRNIQHVWLVVAGFIGLSVLTGMIPAYVLNGSIGYLPALLFLSWLAAWHYVKIRPGHMLLASAAGLFIVSLTFRTIDEYLCDHIPMGTHFMWHILNAGVLYLTTRGYMMGRTVIFRPDPTMLQEYQNKDPDRVLEFVPDPNAHQDETKH